MNGPSDRQKALLDAEDWRFHAIGPVGTGLGIIATTENVSLSLSKVVSFGLPSAPALFLSLAGAANRRRASLQLDSVFVGHRPPQGIFPDEHAGLFDYLQEMVAEIAMSFSAIEAFANESIPEGYAYQFTQTNKPIVTLTGVDIERRVSLDEKLSALLPKAHGVKSPKGTKPWESFKKLKALRDRLIHLKRVDRRASGPADQTIWGALIECRNQNFALDALAIIGAFPTLVKDRRWFQLANGALRAPTLKQS
jgi:hypothetical protein